MSDKLKTVQEPIKNLGSNVITVPPRRKQVRHKGLHGWLEFHPISKLWSYTVKFLYPVTHKGKMHTEAEAELEIKKLLDLASKGNNKHVRTTD